uniref:Uncharacterized protein n=1 Tax=Salix viminalis TaxID=40686 RepID=A0A6N2M805_SALVM
MAFIQSTLGVAMGMRKGGGLFSRKNNVKGGRDPSPAEIHLELTYHHGQERPILHHGHFPLLAAGGGGDFNLGEMGGDSSEGCLVFVPAALPAGCINGIGGTAAGSGAGDFAGESLLSGWLRSKLGT